MFLRLPYIPSFFLFPFYLYLGLQENVAVIFYKSGLDYGTPLYLPLWVSVYSLNCCFLSELLPETYNTDLNVLPNV